MLWTGKSKYMPKPFAKETELEAAIRRVERELFGSRRVYLEIKRKIGAKEGTRNVPDGYLLDLTSAKRPQLYVVENELASHHPLKHIAVQLLEFSLSFEASPLKVKAAVKEALAGQPDKRKQVEEYAAKSGFDNLDHLLEHVVSLPDAFNALVIIDELSPELETALVSRFKFPVEILTLARFAAQDGSEAFSFVPFLSDVTGDDMAAPSVAALDPADIDTIVVPAREEGFQEVFLGENRWYSIRVHSSMIPRIRHIAAYRVAPVSAITHIAPVASVEPFKDSGKYVVILAEPAREIDPIRLVPKGRVKALQNLRYTSRDRLLAAADLDKAF